MAHNNITPFWKPNSQNGCYSQWYLSNFAVDFEHIPDQIKNLSFFKDQNAILKKVDGRIFNCAEQFMMAMKALLFEDNNIFRQVVRTTNPSDHKNLGRSIKAFEKDIWDHYCRDIVKIGNYLKFSQDPELKQKILNSKPNILVEASPYDTIWGVGIADNNPSVYDQKNWKGTNYLGECLMFVRELV